MPTKFHVKLLLMKTKPNVLDTYFSLTLSAVKFSVFIRYCSHVERLLYCRS